MATTTLEMVQQLYAYHRWANHRLFDLVTGLGEETARRDVGKHFSFPTLKGMFAHLYGADLIWLSRWKGSSPSRLMGDGDFSSLVDLRSRWNGLEAEQKDFVERLAPPDLERVVEYRNTEGKALSASLWRLLQHVPNHATHHRSEIATMITMISGSPPDTGINSYIVAMPGADSGARPR